MGAEEKTKEELLQENDDLRTQLREAEETLHAIRNGEVDAVVVSGPEGEQVFTLKGVDHTYRRLIEEMQEGASSLSPDGTILYANRRLGELLTIPIEKLIGSSLHQFVALADREAFEALLRQGGQGIAGGELTLTAADGTQVPVYLSLSSLQLDEMPVLCVVITDLTEHKRAEELVAAERLSRCILDQATESIVVCDENGQIIRASQMAQVFCGQNPLLQPFDSVFPLQVASKGELPSTEAEERFSILSILRGVGIKNQEARFSRADGQKFTLLLSGRSLSNEKGEILGCVITLADITERTRAEEELKHLNLVLRAIRNVNQLITRVQDRDQLLQDACTTLIKTLGYKSAWIVLLDDSGGVIKTAEAGLSADFLRMVEQLKRGILPECAQRAISEPGVVVTKDPVSSCGSCPLTDAAGGRGAMTVRLEHGGAMYGLVTLSLSAEFLESEEERTLLEELAGDLAFALHNIELEEKRKQAEDAFRKSERQASAAIEAARALTFNYEIATGKVEWGGAIEEITGYKEEEFAKVDIDGWAERIHPDDRAKMLSILQEAMGKDRATAEYRFKTRKGYITLSSISLTDKLDVKAVRLVGTLQDITERKMAEEALEDANEKWTSLTGNTNDIVMVVDKNGVIHYINRTIPPYTVKKTIGKTIYDYVPEEQHSIMEESLRRVFKTGISESYDVSSNVPQIGSIWFNTKAVPIKRRKKVTDVILISADITERKLAEEALKSQMHDVKKLNQLFVGREHRMVKLKREVNALREQLGQPKKYDVPNQVEALKRSGVERSR